MGEASKHLTEWERTTTLAPISALGAGRRRESGA